MSKEKKISLAIVFGVLALTVFFFFEALNLTINGDFTRFFPWDEIDDVYYVESTEREETKTKSAGINDDFIYSSHYKTGLNASADAVLAEEEKDYASRQMLNWYIAEQVEEEANVMGILDSLRLVGEDKRMWCLGK